MANKISIGRHTVTIIPDGTADFDIATIQGRALPLNSITGNFVVGEVVTQAVSGATGVVQDWKNKTLYLNDMGGTFNITNALTGGTSTASGIPAHVGPAFPNGIRLKTVDFFGSTTADKLVLRDRVITGPIIYQRKDTSAGGLNNPIEGVSYKSRPVFDMSECTFTTPGSVRIMLGFD